MTIPSFHFEAKKHAYRQTQDGIVVSFVVHPNEVNSSLAIAALGTRYMVALAEIGDDGQAIPPGATTGAAIGSAAVDHPHPPERSAAPGGTKRERTLPEKVGMRCCDRRFQRWVGEKYGLPSVSEDEAASYVRDHCNVNSRTQILPGTEAARKWDVIEGMYLSATGQMAERR